MILRTGPLLRRIFISRVLFEISTDRKFNLDTFFFVTRRSNDERISIPYMETANTIRSMDLTYLEMIRIFEIIRILLSSSFLSLSFAMVELFNTR